MSRVVLLILIALAMGVIFVSHPFMRYPYDMWAHLISIDNSYDYTSIPKVRRVWHLIWRWIFNSLSISRGDILLRAEIIHTTQTLISFWAIYLFSLVVIRNLYTTIESLHHHYMAYWSTIIWFTIFATFSTYYHHTWIMWYSISYQITLPLFFYITALTLILFLEDNSLLKRLFYLLQIVIISLFILRVHSMEYFYYMLYMSIFLLLFAKETIVLLRKYYYIVIPLVVLFIIFTKLHQGDEARLLSYITNLQFVELYHTIVDEGRILVAGANRADASINEMMWVVGFLAIVMILSMRNRRPIISLRLFIFIIITSLFITIPLFVFSAGLASLFTKITVVNRIYYSSSLFLLLPISLYYITYRYRNNIWVFNLSIVSVIIATILYSKSYSTNPNYYANIQSLKQSIFKDKVRFNLSKEQIKTIKEELTKYPKDTPTSPQILFWARADIAVVLKYIYHQNVFWRGRRASPTKEQFRDYCASIDPKDIKCVVFETPNEFGEYRAYH